TRSATTAAPTSCSSPSTRSRSAASSRSRRRPRRSAPRPPPPRRPRRSGKAWRRSSGSAESPSPPMHCSCSAWGGEGRPLRLDLLRPLLPVRLFQHVLLDLADRRFREVRDELDEAWALEAREVLLAMRRHLRFGERGAGLERDIGGRQFAELLV